MTKQKKPQSPQEYMPTAEEVQAELAKVQSMDDFFGKEGVFAKLFASTLEQMLEGELTEHLGYEPYEAAGRNSGNNRNGRYAKKVRTSTGEASVQVPVSYTHLDVYKRQHESTSGLRYVQCERQNTRCYAAHHSLFR